MAVVATVMEVAVMATMSLCNSIFAFARCLEVRCSQKRQGPCRIANIRIGPT